MARPLLSNAALMVVINPFLAPLDEKGRPCTIVQYDPDHTAAGSVRRIGCSLDRRPLKDERPRGNGRGSPSQYPRFDTTVVYDLGAKPIKHSVYHLNMVRDGALLPADEATAALCWVKFVPPAETLSVALREAVTAWLLEHPGATIDPQAWIEAGQFTGWFTPSVKPDASAKPISADDAAVAAAQAADKAMGEAASALRAGVEAGAEKARRLAADRMVRAEKARIIAAERMTRAERVANMFRAVANPAPRGEL